MPNSGYLDTVFATSGDRTAVPDGVQGSGAVSYTQGYGGLYSTAVGSGGFEFPRAQHNQILYDITSVCQQYQQNGIPPFITSSMNGGTPYSYNQYARVLSGGVAYESLVSSNTDTPPSAKWKIAGQSAGLVADFKNLSVSRASNTTLTMTCDEATAETVLGGTVYKGANLNLTLNIGATGANGMDTGSASASSPLYVYLIYNPTTNTFALLGTVTGPSNIYGGSHMPSGYVASGKVTSIVLDGSTHIPIFQQRQGNVYIVNSQVLSAGTSGVLAAVNCANCIASDAIYVGGYINCDSGSGVTIDLAGDTSGTGRKRITAAGTSADASFDNVPVYSSTSIYYLVSSGSFDIYISSYRLW